MGYKKVIDVRLQYSQKTDPTLQIMFGLYEAGVGGIKGKSSRPTLAPIVALFEAGRECYWNEDSSTFTTDPVSQWTPEPEPPSPGGGAELPQWRVSTWDILINAAEGTAQVRLALVGPEDSRESSGSVYDASVTMNLQEQDISAVVALLTSRYCFYQDGSLGNSQIT